MHKTGFSRLTKKKMIYFWGYLREKKIFLQKSRIICPLSHEEWNVRICTLVASHNRRSCTVYTLRDRKKSIIQSLNLSSTPEKRSPPFPIQMVAVWHGKRTCGESTSLHSSLTSTSIHFLNSHVREADKQKLVDTPNEKNTHLKFKRRKNVFRKNLVK